MAATTTNTVQQFFDELQAHKTILDACTNLFTTLSNHFSSLQDSLSHKSQLLDSKFQALDSHSNETLQSLQHRENSIPERESASAARIEEQKEAALADLQNPTPGSVELSATLKSLSRKMDSSSLLRFIVSKRKESASLRAEIAPALAEAVDPPRLVLDAVEEFLNSKTAKSGITDKRWACGLLIQALFPESGEFSRRTIERAVSLLELWKGQLDGESENGAAEVVMFLQMVVCFGLRSRFDDEYLRKSVMEFASRRDMAKLAASLQFRDKMIDIIDELIKNGKEIEAVYFASESGLTERFPPINLLKSYLRNYKKNVNTLSKRETADDFSNTSELNSIKAIIKCVEDHKLESEFNLDTLRKRVTYLEKTKAERKKSSSSGSKSQRKRAYGLDGSRGGGSSSSRPAKSAKFNSYTSSFNRRNMTPLLPSPGTRFSGTFNYPSQTIFDGSTANPYTAAAAYGSSHTQSPAGITQQHYTLDTLGPSGSGYRSSVSFSGQTSYGAYDYANAVPPTYQPPYTVDQTGYRG